MISESFLSKIIFSSSEFDKYILSGDKKINFPMYSVSSNLLTIFIPISPPILNFFNIIEVNLEVESGKILKNNIGRTKQKDNIALKNWCLAEPKIISDTWREIGKETRNKKLNQDIFEKEKPSYTNNILKEITNIFKMIPNLLPFGILYLDNLQAKAIPKPPVNIIENTTRNKTTYKEITLMANNPLIKKSYEKNP